MFRQCVRPRAGARELRIVVFGDSGAGKTVLIGQLSGHPAPGLGKPQEQAAATRSATQPVRLVFYEVPGQSAETHRDQIAGFRADLAIVVVDAGAPDAPEASAPYVSLYRELYPEGRCVVLYNKLDLIPDRNAQLLAFLDQNRYCVSCRSGDGIGRLFQDITAMAAARPRG